MFFSTSKLLNSLELCNAKSAYFENIDEQENSLLDSIAIESFASIKHFSFFQEVEPLKVLSLAEDTKIHRFFLKNLQSQFDSSLIKYSFLDSHYNADKTNLDHLKEFHFCSLNLPCSTSFFKKLRKEYSFTTLPGTLFYESVVYIDIVNLLMLFRRKNINPSFKEKKIRIHKDLINSRSPSNNQLLVHSFDVVSNKLHRFTTNSITTQSLLDHLPNNLVSKRSLNLFISSYDNQQLVNTYFPESKIVISVGPKDFNKRMMIAYKNKGGGGNQPIEAIISGLNCRSEFADEYHPNDEGVRIVWGVLRNSKNIINHCIQEDLHFIYVDHSYFNRGHGISYRLSPNSFECNTYKDCGPERRNLFDIKIEPWRKSGKNIIVCPPTDYFCEAHQTFGWLESTVSQLKKYTDRKIIVRKKPPAGQKSISLQEQLQNAHALVTHSSNVAVEAICLGTPVFVSDKSAASIVGQTDLSLIEKPIYPDREVWLNNLTYCQFTYDELKTGTFWDIFKYYHSLPECFKKS